MSGTYMLIAVIIIVLGAIAYLALFGNHSDVDQFGRPLKSGPTGSSAAPTGQ